MEFFIWGVDAIIRQGESDQHRWYAEHLLKGVHHRYGSSRPKKNRRASKPFDVCACCGAHCRMIPVNQRGIRGKHCANARPHSPRRDAGNVASKDSVDLLRVLIGYQTHVDLGHRLRWNDRFASFSLIAADDSVKRECRAYRRQFVKRITALTPGAGSLCVAQDRLVGRPSLVPR